MVLWSPADPTTRRDPVNTLGGHSHRRCEDDPAAREHGIVIPDRLAVCGFGDFEIAAANELPFTTITVEAARIGQDATDIILARLAGGNAQRFIRVPFRALQRSSS